MADARDEQEPKQQPMVEIRDSQVHGLGAFALRRIPKGTRIIEYLGERVSHDEADRRYESKDAGDNHTFLFIVDNKTVIDAGVDGNEARFFNHSCDPNCESVVENRRVFIEAIRAIEPGQEMTYDYQIQRERDDPENIDEIFACRCGVAKCRGTMLWPPKRPKRRAAARKKAGQKAKQATAKTLPKKGKKKATSARRGTMETRSKASARNRTSPSTRKTARKTKGKSARRR
jgi:hypothetical protein